MTRTAAALVRSTVALLFAAILWPDVAAAWGGQGHRIVARLAMRQIRRDAKDGDADARRARRMVYQAIASDSAVTLESAAVFPDTVRRKEPYTYADNWHFVSIPRAETAYDAAAQCKVLETAPDGDCAVGGLEYFRKVVVEEEGAPNTQTLDALSFIIHIIGDIHQPLHASEDLSFIHEGRPGDRGGNFRPVCFLGASRSACTTVWDGQREPKNLHATWDKLILIQSGKTADETAYVDELWARITGVAEDKALDAETVASYAAGAPAQWAEEAHALAREAVYTPLLLRDTDIPHSSRYDDFYYVDAAYQKANIDHIELQLIKASVRLATYLEQIAHDLP